MIPPQVLGASRSFVINGPVAAFGYAAGYKAMATSGAARLAQQLVALKQLTPAASRLLLSYLIFGKPLAIAAASELHGTDAAAVHGTFLIARNGADLLQETNYRSRGFTLRSTEADTLLQVVQLSREQYSAVHFGRHDKVAAARI